MTTAESDRRPNLEIGDRLAVLGSSVHGIQPGDAFQIEYTGCSVMQESNTRIKRKKGMDKYNTIIELELESSFILLYVLSFSKHLLISASAALKKLLDLTLWFLSRYGLVWHTYIIIIIFIIKAQEKARLAN